MKYFRKNNYMHMPHKSGKNGTLFMTEDTKRVRQKGDSMRGRGGKGGECREELEERPLHELFCGFWQCQDTTHDTKPNGKKTYQACWRSCYSRCCCCCCSTRSSSKGGTRDAANKTKQNKAEQSRAEWSGVEWSAGSSSYTRNKIQLIFKREIAVNNSTEQSVASRKGEGAEANLLRRGA